MFSILTTWHISTASRGGSRADKDNIIHHLNTATLHYTRDTAINVVIIIICNLFPHSEKVNMNVKSCLEFYWSLCFKFKCSWRLILWSYFAIKIFAKVFTAVRVQASPSPHRARSRMVPAAGPRPGLPPAQHHHWKRNNNQLLFLGGSQIFHRWNTILISLHCL